jgi:predicted Mrr-cat superfamily restriction endonuclease
MPEEMEISKDNSETKKEVKELDIQEIKNETNSQLNNSLDMDKGKIIKQLKKAKNVEERVKLFAKWTDSYGLEAIA